MWKSLVSSNKKDFEELVANCKSEFVTYNKVKGVKFTSKINGHSIFLPFSGYNMYVIGWKNIVLVKMAIIGLLLFTEFRNIKSNFLFMDFI